jgi:hypothetical protein
VRRSIVERVVNQLLAICCGQLTYLSGTGITAGVGADLKVPLVRLSPEIPIHTLERRRRSWSRHGFGRLKAGSGGVPVRILVLNERMPLEVAVIQFRQRIVANQ